MRPALRTLFRLSASALAGALLYSRFAVPHDLPLPEAIDAPRARLELPGFGPLAYYADARAQGRPLLLVHSVNAAASSFEMRPLFEALRGERPVYALDLPGFGFSERPDTDYTPELYARAVSLILGHIARKHPGQPSDVVALSLGSEFAARAALAGAPLRSLALLSPSGLGRPRRGTQQAGEAGSSERVRGWLAFSLWAQALYDLIASRPSIHYFLRQSFQGPVDPELERYGYASSHRPGARHAPLSFIAGRLFTPDAFAELYSRLTQPTLIVYDQDAFVSFDRLPELVSGRDNVRALRLAPTRGLPQFERLPELQAALEQFWRQPSSRTIT